MGIDGELSEFEKACIIILCNVEVATIDYEYDVDQIEKEQINPEKITIKRDIIEKMSLDAQDVFDIICSNPRLIDVFCHGGRINQRRFIFYMKSKGFFSDWTLLHARNVFEELKQALKEMIT